MALPVYKQHIPFSLALPLVNLHHPNPHQQRQRVLPLLPRRPRHSPRLRAVAHHSPVRRRRRRRLRSWRRGGRRRLDTRAARLGLGGPGAHRGAAAAGVAQRRGGLRHGRGLLRPAPPQPLSRLRARPGHLPRRGARAAAAGGGAGSLGARASDSP